MNNNNIDTNPCGPISEADKLRIFAAYASDDLARLHAEFGFPESQPIDVDDMIAALRLARPSPAPVKSVGEDATRAINGILRVVDADKTGDLHLLLGDDIETLTNCIDSLLAAANAQWASRFKALNDALALLESSGRASDERYERLLAARTVADAPAGWKLVPIEPTEAMYDALTRHPQKHPQIREEYRAMLAAAPPVAADQPAHDVMEELKRCAIWIENIKPEELELWRATKVADIHRALRSQPAQQQQQQGDSNAS